jgi:Ser/Thr protein kinase RdoA (MazF antagonist)
MRPEQHVPPDVPRTLLEELDRRDARVTKHATEGRRTYLWLDAEDGPLFARSSTDPIDVAVFEHEVATREVVGRREPMRVPAVLARGDSWLLEEAVDGRPIAGRADLQLAIKAAATISALSLPPAPPVPAETRWARVMRRLRLLRFPKLLPELRRAQRILRAPQLPEVTSHGDFHPGNLLVTDTSLYVFDWEMVGVRPAGHDLLQLWTSQAAPEDREYVFAGALELVGNEHRSALERLRYAVLVETAAIKLSTALRVSRDIKGARRLLSLLPAVRPPGRDAAG